VGLAGCLGAAQGRSRLRRRRAPRAGALGIRAGRCRAAEPVRRGRGDE